MRTKDLRSLDEKRAYYRLLRHLLSQRLQASYKEDQARPLPPRMVELLKTLEQTDLNSPDANPAASECPLWVNSGHSVPGPKSSYVRCCPKADKLGFGWIVCFVPKADISQVLHAGFHAERWSAADVWPQ